MLIVHKQVQLVETAHFCIYVLVGVRVIFPPKSCGSSLQVQSGGLKSFGVRLAPNPRYSPILMPHAAG